MRVVREVDKKGNTHNLCCLFNFVSTQCKKGRFGAHLDNQLAPAQVYLHKQLKSIPGILHPGEQPKHACLHQNAM